MRRSLEMCSYAINCHGTGRNKKHVDRRDASGPLQSLRRMRKRRTISTRGGTGQDPDRRDLPSHVGACR